PAGDGPLGDRRVERAGVDPLRTPLRLRAGRHGRSVLPAAGAGLPAIGLHLRAGRVALVNDHSVVLPRNGDLVIPGGLPSALGPAVEPVVERDPVPDPQARA